MCGELAGKSEFSKQIPLKDAVPLWGGISSKGFHLLTFHPTKKLQQPEWEKALNKGALTAALPGSTGPWTVLSDNEYFLNSPPSRALYRKLGVRLLQVPARSPDLNPIEKFWGLLRVKLRQLDLKDAQAGRPPIGKSALRQRILAVARTKAAKKAAANYIRGLRKVCLEVVAKNGARASS